jgi:nucleoside-diphosphate-sugar epimerase
MASGKVLICGALGTVGRSALDHFEKLTDWQIVGMGRRKPDFPTRADWLAVDLRDDACQKQIREVKGITHVIYAALYERTENLTGAWTENEHVETNLKMLRNTIEAVEASNPELRHITLLQGTKAYGGHLGPFRMPARESDPRYMPPNFYYNQQDWLSARQVGKRWSWTVLRPQIVCGNTIGSPLNIVTGIGVYAAISREHGIPLRFPGGPSRVSEATDARLIAKAAHWAMTEPRCANEIFNIANGDVFLWENVWPKLADVFKMKLEPPHPFSLNRLMPGNEPVWNRIVDKYNLKRYDYKTMVPSWQLIDYLLGYGQRPNPHHLSTIKARKFGFHDCVDTEEMFVDLLTELQETKVLPP